MQATEARRRGKPCVRESNSRHMGVHIKIGHCSQIDPVYVEFIDLVYRIRSTCYCTVIHLSQHWWSHPRQYCRAHGKHCCLPASCSPAGHSCQPMNEAETTATYLQGTVQRC